VVGGGSQLCAVICDAYQPSTTSSRIFGQLVEVHGYQPANQLMSCLPGMTQAPGQRGYRDPVEAGDGEREGLCRAQSWPPPACQFGGAGSVEPATTEQQEPGQGWPRLLLQAVHASHAIDSEEAVTRWAPLRPGYRHLCW
jgi:hypothetical protein